MSGEENRVHARIQVSTSIEVRPVRGGQERSATLKDLSKGGARFLVSGSVGNAGDEVELLLPSLSGPDIAVIAQIIRSTPGSDGDTVACRFDNVPIDMRQPLLDLIEVLLSTSSASVTRLARVARRMDIGFSDLVELRVVLDEIAAGGLRMVVSTPLVLYEELDITVPDTNGDQLLILHAHVIGQREILGPPISYEVDLEMNALRPETRRCLDSLRDAVHELAPDIGTRKGA